VGVSLLIAIGFVVIMLWPSSMLGALIAGIGCGGSLGTVIVMFSARSSSPEETGSLSGMAQSVGYVLAASGPIMFGLLHDVTKGWTVPVLTVASLAMVQALMGFIGGRPGVLGEASRRGQIARPAG